VLSARAAVTRHGCCWALALAATLATAPLAAQAPPPDRRAAAPELPAAALLVLPDPVPVTVSNLRLVPFRYYRQYIMVELTGVAAADVEKSRVTQGVDGDELVWRRLASFRDPQTGEPVLPDELLIEMDDATGRNLAQALADGAAATRGGGTVRFSCLFVRSARADHCRVYVVAVRRNARPAGTTGNDWTRYGIRSIVGFDRLTPPEKAAAIERFFPDLWTRIAPGTQ
jgi:hypothetical protein